MNHNHKTPTMNQKIFDIGLSVETISLYLLCCSLVDANEAITTKNLRDIWNGTESELLENLEILEKMNILVKTISDREQFNVYRMTDSARWRAVSSQ